MTEKHPLTKEMLDNIAPWPIKRLPGEYDTMRTVADWQLMQVIEWLRENLRRNWIEEDGSDWYLDPWELVVPEKVVSDLKEAMRPQQLEDN